jgi:hypothetical protein
MKAIKELAIYEKDIGQKLFIEFIGEVHPLFKEGMMDDEILREMVVFSGNIPHKQLLNKYGESSLLLLILTGYKDAEGFLPGKLFEYLATGLPVLGVGPVNGDAANLLREVGQGTMLASDDLFGIKDFIKSEYSNWLSGKARVVSISGSKKYSRKEITQQLVELL